LDGNNIKQHLILQRKCGKYKEWSCKKADVQAAQIVCDTVDALVPKLFALSCINNDI